MFLNTFFLSIKKQIIYTQSDAPFVRLYELGCFSAICKWEGLGLWIWTKDVIFCFFFLKKHSKLKIKLLI